MIIDKKGKERAPIHISNSDIIRAFKKAEEFNKLIEKGKTPQQIFDDMVKMIIIDEE